MRIVDLSEFAANHDDDHGMDPWTDSISWKRLRIEGVEAIKLKEGYFRFSKWGPIGDPFTPDSIEIVENK